MNKDDRHATGCPAHHPARGGCTTSEGAWRSLRMAGFALVGMVLAGLGGCTFVEQTDDLLKGGPTQRVDAAKRRQSDAIDIQQTLKRTHQELTEQQAIEEAKLEEMRKHLDSQNARIARARESQRITEVQQRDLHARVSTLAGEIGDLEFRIQAARAVGETGNDVQLQERLQALRREAEQIEEEIRSLEE